MLGGSQRLPMIHAPVKTEQRRFEFISIPISATLVFAMRRVERDANALLPILHLRPAFFA